MNFTSTASIAVALPAGAKIVLAEGTTNTITSTNSSSNQSSSFGIDAGGSLTIEGSGTLIVTGGAAELRSCGICLDGDGDLTINGGTVKATGGASQMTYGIQTAGSATISGGTVTAIGGTSTVDGSSSYGIFAGGGLTINSGIVTATGSQATYSRGIGARYKQTVNITGGTVTATGGTAQRESNGIYAYSGNITISGGHVTAQTLSTTGEKSALNVEPDLSKYSGYQWRTGASDAFITTRYTYSAAHTYVEFSQGAAPTTCTVSFDDNGGTLTGWTSTKTKADGTVDYLPRATCEGYTFDGWYTEQVGGNKVYTYVTVFTADTTVYAHWTPEADTKQITEAVFGLKGYAVGEDAEDIVITSYTEGLSLVGGYYKALGQPYSYLIAVVSGSDYAPVTGPLEAGKKYVLMLKADVNAGYDVGSGLTEADVTLNSTIAAADCGENKEESTLGITFVLPVLTENDTPAAAYTVTVNGSYASATGAGEYEEGDLVTLAAGTRSGYTFSGWTSDDITIPNAGSADTSFAMPAKAVAVTANWTADAPIVVPGDPVKPADPVQPVIPFTDVPMGAYYEDAVLWAVSEGITSGTTASTFSPNAACTRAQAVTFLWRAAGSPAPKSAAMPFTDVAEGSYYYDAVLWAVENGITKGTSDTTFSPNATCTRAQIVTFLWRSQKSPAAGTANPFTDVAADAYCADAVRWAVANGVTDGTSATTFSPNSDCTRAQIVTFLYRCLG